MSVFWVQNVILPAAAIVCQFYFSLDTFSENVNMASAESNNVLCERLGFSTSTKPGNLLSAQNSEMPGFFVLFCF